MEQKALHSTYRHIVYQGKQSLRRTPKTTEVFFLGSQDEFMEFAERKIAASLGLTVKNKYLA